jgi:hypothetical protein
MMKTLNLLVITGSLMIFSTIIFMAAALFSFIIFVGMMQDLLLRAYIGIWSDPLLHRTKMREIGQGSGTIKTVMPGT